VDADSVKRLACRFPVPDVHETIGFAAIDPHEIRRGIRELSIALPRIQDLRLEPTPRSLIL